MFLLPALGIIFLFLGILLFVLLFLNDLPRTWQDILNRSLQLSMQDKKSSDEQQLFFKEGVAIELDKKNRIRNIAIGFSITITFMLFLYLVSGAVTLWYFRDNWHVLTEQKFLFSLFYVLGMLLMILAIFLGVRIQRLDDLSLFGSYIPGRFFPNFTGKWNAEQIHDQYHATLISNAEKERLLQSARYLFLFIFFILVILAIILMFHFHY